MMKIVFLGVGEAFDEKFPNSSHLILSDTKLLLDCGYTAPVQIWKYNPDQSLLDALYISHTHADHYFGIPPLLTRMWEEKRKKPLTIICPRGSKQTVEELIEYGYRGISGLYEFTINYREADAQRSIWLKEFKLSFSQTEHPANNHAVKISDGNHKVCYSGDGMFRKETEDLYRNADLVIHEAYTLDKKIPNHACIKDLIDMAKRNNVKCLALTHLQRDFRKIELEKLKKEVQNEEVKVLIPEPFEEYEF
jgi:ribonuclease BN (tRNA processing enzyme)